jgi:hypothetical protein
MQKTTELKGFIEKIVDKVITQTKQQKLEEQKKLNEAKKKKLEEQKKLDEFKLTLHGILKPVDWEKLTLEESKKLVSILENWINKNK